MKKRQILKALSLLTAICMAAGCNGSTAVETTSATAEITTTEVTGQTDSNSELPELEVDYVDEVTNIVYYNVVDNWKYDDFINSITINGNIINGITLNDFDEYCTIEEKIDMEYNPETGYCEVQIFYNDTPLALLVYKNIENIDAIYDEEFDIIRQLDYCYVMENNYKVLQINGVGMNSTKDEVKNALGNPIGEQEWILLYANEGLVFTFDDTGKVMAVDIDLNKINKNENN